MPRDALPAASPISPLSPQAPVPGPAGGPRATAPDDGRRLIYGLLLSLAFHGVLLALADFPAASPAIAPPVLLAVNVNKPVEMAARTDPHPAPHRSEPVPASMPPREPSPAVQTSPVALSPIEAPANTASKTLPVAATNSDQRPQVTSPPRFDAAYLNNPRPAYPFLSKRLNEQGEVKMRVHVLPTGQADQVEISETSGYVRLDNAAVEAVRHWRFVPARLGGEAIADWVTVPLAFNLDPTDAQKPAR